MDEVVEWLFDPGARGLLPHELIAGLVERLLPTMSLWRVSTGLRTMHPEVAVVSLTWTADQGVAVADVPHSQLRTGLADGPIPQLIRSGQPILRARLDGPPHEVPMLRRFQEQGATDYVLLLLPGTRDQILSLTTRAPGGFTEGQVADLLRLRMPLSLRLDLALSRHITHSLLGAYLGRHAAKQVLEGRYLREGGQRLQVIVFTCDLRGFTDRVDHGPLETVLTELDAYFDCVSEPWVDAGGEILKFVGDAVLGILPLGDDPADAARRALRAAQQAFEALEAASEALPPGRPPLRMGWVLHAGEVVYGNIGSRQRVDFTVIGRCVNEAARLEKLTKELAPLVLSEAFVEQLGTATELRELGAHALRGVSQPVTVYTPRG